MDKTVHSEAYKRVLREFRAARKAQGVSQSDLADRIAETQSFVSKCERGERRIDVVELAIFCRAIGVSFIDFIKQIEPFMHSTVR